MVERFRTPVASNRAARLALPVVFALTVSSPALAFDYQVHGYAAQGFVLSSGNNFFGNSTEGSLKYYEVGLNAEMQLLPNLLFAAQGAVRRAGITDAGRPRLDYAVLDYRFLPGADANAGLRIGKVKNTVGFFNETRDVVFTRPSILLPSLYSDNQNQRDLVFTAPGAQLYGNMVWGHQELSFTGTASGNRNVGVAEERLLINLNVPSSLRIRDSWNAQVMDSIDGGRWEFAVSAIYARLILTAVLPTTPPDPVYGTIGVELEVVSARYNAERFSLTAEYAINPNRLSVAVAGATVLQSNVIGDSGYLQADYRIAPDWNVMARYDVAFRDRSDRSGRAYAAANPGANPASRYGHDFTVGLNWRYGEHWGFWGEYHLIDGNSTVQPTDNTGRELANHWSMLLLMIGYKF